MSSDFETEKNVKAGTITGVITGALFLFFFLVSWSMPVIPPPPVEEGLEVNLGDSDDGLGDVQPLVPGAPSAAEKQVNTPPKASNTPVQQVKTIETDDNDEDAPDVNVPKPKVADPKATTIPTKENTSVAKNNNTKKEVVQNPAPAPPKPKAVYAGGKNTGSSGNNADSYNNSRNQGVAGGSGDQGKPNGNPNSDSYTGNGGTGSAGISIANGLQGRKLAGGARFQDQYKYGGKVAVDVTVNESGTVTNAKVKPGSPFADLNSIAVKRAYQLKFNKGTTPQTGTIMIVFQNPKG